jgi:spore coat protein U-like protein
MRQALARCACALAAGWAGGSAFASSTCVINSVAAAAFGLYDGTLNDSATTLVSGRCINSPPPGSSGVLAPVISLSTGVSGSYATRQMANGANRLNYNLYTSAARTTVWGNGTGGTATVAAYAAGSVTINGNQSRAFDSPNLTIHGRIPADQSSPQGAYSDTIVLTLTF